MLIVIIIMRRIIVEFKCNLDKEILDFRRLLWSQVLFEDASRYTHVIPPSKYELVFCIITWISCVELDILMYVYILQPWTPKSIIILVQVFKYKYCE